MCVLLRVCVASQLPVLTKVRAPSLLEQNPWYVPRDRAGYNTSSDSFNAHEQTVNRLKWHTLIIKFGAFCKQILAASINTITMEIMWLKKFGPKLWFGQLMWNELQVFLFHCWICFENTFYNVSCEIVLKSITAICLGFDVSLEPQ
jgi:hypothetical protein